MKLLRGCLKGCLLLILIWAVPYSINMGNKLLSSSENYTKWINSKIPNYTMVIHYQNGSTSQTSEVSVSQNKNIGVTGDPPFNEIKTVDDLFSAISPFRCSLLFPLARCSIDYDPGYGYPSKIEAGCPMIECYSGIQVIEFTVNQ